MENETTFAEGIYFDLPREGAPDYVKGRISFKVAEAVAFLQAHTNNGGYCNLDLKIGKSGKPYAQLNTWQPGKPAALDEAAELPTVEYPTEDIDTSSVPF